jgi:hypothetical protein
MAPRSQRGRDPALGSLKARPRHGSTAAGIDVRVLQNLAVLTFSSDEHTRKGSISFNKKKTVGVSPPFDEKSRLLMKDSIALKCAVITCNVSYAKEIDGDTLVSILRGEQPVAPWLCHVGTFFNEVSEKHIKGVSVDYGIPMEQLARIYFSLPIAYQEKHFPAIYYG